MKLSFEMKLLFCSLEKASEQFRNGLERYLSPDRQLQEHVGEPKQKKILTVLTKEPVIHADSEVTSYLSNQVRFVRYCFGFTLCFVAELEKSEAL